MNDHDLAVEALQDRARRLGRTLDADQLGDLRTSMKAVEPSLAVVRDRPVPLLSGLTDHAWGDEWLRRGLEPTPDQRESGQPR